MTQHFEIRVGDDHVADAATRERADELRRELLATPDSGLRESDVRVIEHEGLLPEIERQIEADR
jgi:hypothetical protein